MSKFIRITIFIAVICSPPFAIYYGIQLAFKSESPTVEQQFAKSLSLKCKTEWQVLQEQSFKQYGVRQYGHAPDYCDDYARNKKVYGY